MTDQYDRQATSPPSGWYPDPAGSGQERFWDGAQWTGQLRQLQIAPTPYPSGYQSAAGYQRSSEWTLQPNYAHWGWRVLAYGIDWLLLNIVVTSIMNLFFGVFFRAFERWQQDFFLFLLAGSSGYPPMPWDYEGSSSGLVVSVLVGYLVFLVYHIAMLSTIGASLGKLAVGLRVAPASSLNAKRLSVSTATVRSFCVVLFGLIPIFNLINWLSPLWREKRQTFHDSAARTVVLKVR